MWGNVEQARREWEEGYRRLEAEASDRARYERLLAQVDVVSAELRRRLGKSFTLAELVELYGTADRWSREAVSERAPASGWPRTLTLVQDSAFHLYSRGASDYEP